MPWIWLTVAIVGEVIATSALKASQGFTRWEWSLVSIAGYAVAFYCLAIVLKTIPVGIAYAIWAGAGVTMVALIGVVVFGQALDLAAILGIGLIVAGVIVLNVFSSSVQH
ncbi:MAG: multidrug efflux SMR transporter [Pseudomonadota bacterium]